MEIYQVKLGDSLTAIARDVLGDQAAWRKIAQLNNIPSPYVIRPGQQLVMPDLEVLGPVVVPDIARRVPTTQPQPPSVVKAAGFGFDLSAMTPTTWAYLALGAAFLFVMLGKRK